MSTSLWAALLGCHAPGAPELVFLADSPVRVDRLGPVDGARIMLADGAQPHGLLCEAKPPGVAHFDGNQLVADAAGTAQLACQWEDQEVEVVVEVELATHLQLVDAPAHLKVGEVVQLQLEARREGHPLPVSRVLWESSDPAVVEVDAGRAHGKAPGMSYVTARARGAQVTVQLEVRR